MPAHPPLAEMLEFAEETARRAGALTLDLFQSARLHIEAKADGSPVTEADRRAERLIRERIGEYFPAHAILGEEFGATGGAGGSPGTAPRHRWIIDPIDGTKSFVHGVPLYGVMLALEIDGTPSLGVLHFPVLNETVAAATGLGCHFNGVRCHVDATADLSAATVLASGVNAFYRRAKQDAFATLLAHTKIFRTWGDCYGYALVATGRAQIMLDAQLEVYDAAPMLPILAEAGGRFSDWQGRATAAGGDGIGTNGLLHEQVLALLAGG